MEYIQNCVDKDVKAKQRERGTLRGGGSPEESGKEDRRGKMRRVTQ